MHRHSSRQRILPIAMCLLLVAGLTGLAAREVQDDFTPVSPPDVGDQSHAGDQDADSDSASARPRGRGGNRGSGGGPGGESGAPGGSETPDIIDEIEASEYPPFEEASKGLDKVISTADGSASLYTLYASKKDGRLLAELPRNYSNKLLMIATTVSGGDEDAGVMGGTVYAYWKRIDKNLVLIEPNFTVRSSGDDESKRSVKDLYTDRVILDLPIASVGPGKGPVLDFKALTVGQHMKFFGPGSGGWGPVVYGADARLATLESAKAFPENLEITYRLPTAGGRLVALHYSIRSLPEDRTFKPREADSRVGYFNVYYRELGKPGSDEPTTRYITHWRMEKADPQLRLSPPKQPIVWYIEDSTPIRYRQYVREGILSWNKAFEACGIVNALEVYQQDAATGAHMDKDPEDARYNFFRWNTSSQAYAIGPSRVDPRNGRIVDADVVWHAGLTESIGGMLRDLSGEIATVNFTPETMEWLEQHPQWDPRVRMAPAPQRERMLGQRRGVVPMPAQHKHDAAAIEPAPLSTTWHSGAQCKIGEYLSMNIGLFSAALDAKLLQGRDGGDEDGPSLDGLPEEFLGPMIRYVSAHEVGHTLGLQHNFSASTIRSLQQINSAEYDGSPTIGSVMEYAGVNIRAGEEDGQQQGPYASPTIGPYDIWAIQFGYGSDDDRSKILSRVNEGDLIFHNDMSMMSPDPRVMVWDVGADPLAFCDSRMRLVRELRGKIVSDLVKDGQPWRKARERYISLLNNHVQAVAVASRWIGASYINRNYKGDPEAKTFIENVPAERQRQALTFVINNAFRDDAYGLSPALIQHLGLQYWPDAPGQMQIDGDPSFELHDLVAGIQAIGMTLVMNPTTLRRLYDNEFRTNGEENPITLAEVLNSLTAAAWSELEGVAAAAGPYTAAKPMISSFRRNLQREHIERLIDLMMVGDAANPAVRTISTLSAQTMRDLDGKITKALANNGKLDPYTQAHLSDVQTRMHKALEAQYVITK